MHASEVSRHCLAVMIDCCMLAVAAALLGVSHWLSHLGSSAADQADYGRGKLCAHPQYVKEHIIFRRC